MIAEALFSTLLLAEILSQDCFITGEVTWSPQETKASLSTPCPIRIEQDGKLITMTSPKWVVQVTIPEEPGPQEFVYQWGQSEAKIGTRTIEVFYRPVGKS